MKIERLTATNFLGIEQADIELGALTLLYGRNGSGKSSLADALLYALTGEALRGGTLGDLVRQGAKAAEVEVVVEGIEVLRHRTRTGGSQFSNGIEVGAVEVARDLAKLLGAGPKTIGAALRAGALLELKPADLQRMLAELTGAAFDAEAIATELGTAVMEATERAKLPLPRTLEEFAAVCRTAENARQLAKRVLAEREEDLSRTVAPSPALVDALKEFGGGQMPTAAALQQRLAEAKTKREVVKLASARRAGAGDERIRQVKARLKELASVKAPAGAAPDTAAAEKKIGELEKTAGALGEKERAADAALVKLRGRLAEKVSPRDGRSRETLQQLSDAASAATLQMNKRFDALKTSGSTLAAQIEAAQPCGQGCQDHCPDAAGMAAELARQRAEAKELQKQIKQEAALIAQLRAALTAEEQHELGEQVAAQEAARVELLAQAGETTRQIEAARAALEPLRQAAEAHRQAAGLVDEHVRLVGELARLELESAAPAGDLEAAEADVTTGEQLVAAIAQHTTRRSAKEKAEAARRAVEDADAVAQATGPKGARLRLLAKAVEPFTTAANRALALLWPGAEVAVETASELALVLRSEGRTLTPEQLSDGERMRLLYVLQYAVARLARVDVLVLDRAELLDDAGRKVLKKLAATCAAEGLQVVMLTCAAPPAAVPAGVVAYVVEAGRAQRIGAAAAA